MVTWLCGKTEHHDKEYMMEESCPPHNRKEGRRDRREREREREKEPPPIFPFKGMP
jgi:hypothetical protein